MKQDMASKLFDRGICIGKRRHKRGWRAYYGLNHGFGYRWLPLFASRTFVRLFNHIACRIWGHDDILWHIKDGLSSDAGIKCTDCCKPLNGCTCQGGNLC